MNFPDVTVCMATRNAADAVALTLESFYRHHGKFRLHVRDDCSTDGADDVAARFAEIIDRNRKPMDHGPNLDGLVRGVDTPFVLLIDSDVEFLCTCLESMLAEIHKGGAFCVAPTQQPKGTADHYGLKLSGHPRIEPYCALFRTGELKRLLQWFSFSVHVDMGRKLYLDTGAMIWQAAHAAGLEIVECEWLWRRMVHYGGLSTSMLERDNPRQRAYATLQRRLEQFRKGVQVLDGLKWAGHWWQVD